MLKECTGIIPILLLAIMGNAQIFNAGYKTLSLTDSSRVYRNGTPVTDPLHYRLINLDIWYPAQATEPPPLRFKYFLKTFVNRAYYYSADTAPSNMVYQMASSFCNMNKCSDSARLLNFQSSSLQEARAVKGRFPLVVYMASYGSSCFENFPLFEKMAKRGFVVVSISSIGRFPGDMTMQYEDFVQQVQDAAFAINHLSSWPGIDSKRIGIVGYSWGGLAGAALANQLAGAACLVSLDGSEFHHYGYSKKEDTQFDSIIASKQFANKTLTLPYLRLQQHPPGTGVNKKDSIYHFIDKLSPNRLILTVDSAEHYHFCCLTSLVKTSGNCPDSGIYATVTRLTIAFLEEHLKKPGVFKQVLAKEEHETVERI